MAWGLHYAAVDDGWYVAAELNGIGAGCTDITDDVLAEPSVAAEWGMQGTSPVDLVAAPGQFRFALKNGQSNSASTLGYYSPEHANVRDGWALGIRCDLWYSLSGTSYHRFVGWLESVEPDAGQYLDRRALCTAHDYIEELANSQVQLATQVSKRADQIISSLVSALDRQPIATSYATGDSTFPYALDSDSGGEMALTVAQRIVQSEYGLLFVKGTGTLTFVRRTGLVQIDVDATLTDADINAMTAPQLRAQLFNRIRTTTHPRRVDSAATTVLFSLPNKPSVAAGETLTILGYYTDPTLRAARVGGTDMVTPVATTDYTMNTAEDGSGTDLTSSFTVSATFYASHVALTLTNNSGSLGYITLMQARGRGLYTYDPVEAYTSNAASITAYGRRELALDMPYQADPNTALSVAEFILATWKDPAAVGVEARFLAVTAAQLLLALTIEPGDGVRVIETATGISGTYRVQHVRLTLLPGQIVDCSWIMQRVLAENYWTLGTAGKSELGETTVVAPL